MSRARSRPSFSTLPVVSISTLGKKAFPNSALIINRLVNATALNRSRRMAGWRWAMEWQKPAKCPSTAMNGFHGALPLAFPRI
jgi:hypothetical protein